MRHDLRSDRSLRLLAALSLCTAPLLGGCQMDGWDSWDTGPETQGAGGSTPAPPSAPAPAGVPAPAASAGFAGTFEGQNDGVASQLQLEQGGAGLTGVARASGMTFRLEGQVEGARAAGQLLADDGQGLPFEMALTAAGLDLTLYAADPQTGMLTSQRISYRRLAAGGAVAASMPSGGGVLAAGGPAAGGDPALVGVWTKTDSFGGGVDGFTGAVRDTIRVYPDGTYVIGAGEFHGGGPGVGGSSTGGPDQGGGRWRTESSIVHIQEPGSPGFQPFARYYVEGSKLMFTFGDGSREIWYRSN